MKDPEEDVSRYQREYAPTHDKARPANMDLPKGVSPGPVVDGARTFIAHGAEEGGYNSPVFTLGLWETPDEAGEAVEAWKEGEALPDGRIECPRGLYNPNYQDGE